MATAITLYKSQDGKTFDSEAAANAHDLMVSRGEEIKAFVAIHFPGKADAKKKNPHAGTAVKAIGLWLGQGSVQVSA